MLRAFSSNLLRKSYKFAECDLFFHRSVKLLLALCRALTEVGWHSSSRGNINGWVGCMCTYVRMKWWLCGSGDNSRKTNLVLLKMWWKRLEFPSLKWSSSSFISRIIRIPLGFLHCQVKQYYAAYDLEEAATLLDSVEVIIILYSFDNSLSLLSVYYYVFFS
jgi:hypothetical protein